MINFANVRNAIIGGLNTHLNMLVIDGNTVNRKPPYPYMSYVITTAYSKEFENPKSVTFDTDTLTRQEDALMTFSFNAHSLDYDEAHQTILNAIEYFEFQEDLYDSNIVVVNTLPLENRSFLLVDQRERRVGFDVIIRVESSVTKTQDPIDELQGFTLTQN